MLMPPNADAGPSPCADHISNVNSGVRPTLRERISEFYIYNNTLIFKRIALRIAPLIEVLL
jgi:hypothetical protein